METAKEPRSITFLAMRNCAPKDLACSYAASEGLRVVVIEAEVFGGPRERYRTFYRTEVEFPAEASNKTVHHLPQSHAGRLLDCESGG